MAGPVDLIGNPGGGNSPSADVVNPRKSEVSGIRRRQVNNKTHCRRSHCGFASRHWYNNTNNMLINNAPYHHPAVLCGQLIKDCEENSEKKNDMLCTQLARV
jgi:hypothetical protein